MVFIKKIILTLALVSNLNLLFGQKEQNLSMEFYPVFGNSTLILGDTFYRINTHDSIQFETFKFYISAIEFYTNDKLVWKEQKSFHLVDASHKKSLKLLLNTPPNLGFNKLKFNLGIDSITNVSGAMGADLDPTKGMYWTWQSGYINLKLEGKSNLCLSRNNEFQFHLGGYQFPFSSLQSIILPIDRSEKIILKMNIEKLVNELDLSNNPNIMSPGIRAIEISNKVSKIISLP